MLIGERERERETNHGKWGWRRTDQMVRTYQPCPVIRQTSEKALFVRVLVSSSYGSCSWTTGAISLPRTRQGWTRTPPYLVLRSTTHPLQPPPFPSFKTEKERRILDREREDEFLVRERERERERERVELKLPLLVVNAFFLLGALSEKQVNQNGELVGTPGHAVTAQLAVVGIGGRRGGDLNKKGPPCGK
jgi:hypothetical protein